MRACGARSCAPQGLGLVKGLPGRPAQTKRGALGGGG